MNDESFLNQAIELAKKSVAEGGGPFGAVVVKDGKVIAEAANRVTLDHDPTAHAEILAIRKAASVLGTHDLKGCTLYSSCEPCPMCLGAVYWARPDKLFFAAGRTDAMQAGFDDSFIYDQLDLSLGERSIPSRQIRGPEALEPFRLWEKQDGKTPY
ncbi:MAG: nucleoside deaminase [Bacteroidota bacterium]